MACFLLGATTLPRPFIWESSVGYQNGPDYISYVNALENTDLLTLEDRRVQLCLKFARKTIKNPKHCKGW